MNRSNEQNVIQVKLSLVEPERLAQQKKIEAEKQKAYSEKQRLEAERFVHQQKFDADFEYQK